MSDDTNEFDELVSSIGTELIENRGKTALIYTSIAGAVYREAVTAGLPQVLAQEMAHGYWIKEFKPGEW